MLDEVLGEARRLRPRPARSAGCAARPRVGGQPVGEPLGEGLGDAPGRDGVGGRLVRAVEPHGVVLGDDLERALAPALPVERLVDDERIDDRGRARIGSMP